MARVQSEVPSSQEPRGVTSQKTPFLIVTAVKTSNATLPDCWTWTAGAADEEWIEWPPQSPDFIPCDFFLLGYVKEKVFVPPLLLDIDELKLRITAAIKATDRNCYKEYGMSWIRD
jgi:hypothetical protein